MKVGFEAWPEGADAVGEVDNLVGHRVTEGIEGDVDADDAHLRGEVDADGVGLGEDRSDALAVNDGWKAALDSQEHLRIDRGEVVGVPAHLGVDGACGADECIVVEEEGFGSAGPVGGVLCVVYTFSLAPLDDLARGGWTFFDRVGTSIRPMEA